MIKIRFLTAGVLVLGLFCCPRAHAADKQPITVNGDMVEFKAEGREVVAEGHVEILGQDMTMTCDRVRIFMDEKLIIAEDNVRFVRAAGTEEMEGEIIIFDFGSKTGTIIGANVRMSPYYGKAATMEKLSDREYVLARAEVSTCDLPHPHYRLDCREVTMDPGRLLTAKGIKVSILDIPLMYVPYYSHLLTDKRPRLMITPGHSKFFGTEVLGSWRYYLNENAKGLLHFDWYQRRGWAQGLDLNYDTKITGYGNAKYYRIDEKDPEDLSRNRKQRSRAEWRHRWHISDNDHAVLEFFKQSDPNFRKDYFYREYERDMNPLSYFLYSHVFPSATLSFLGQPRVNFFDTVLQKIPELKLETINQKIGPTPFYFKSTSSTSYFSNTTGNLKTTSDVTRLDTANQLQYLFRFCGVDFSPFAGYEETYYSRGVDGKESLNRGMFFGGIDISTKLYKIYDLKTDLWHLKIDRLRHIVTPTVQYRYQHEPTVNLSRIQQMDPLDALDKKDTVTLGLENKLQTKRDGNSVDIAMLLVTADYNFEENATTTTRGFQNIKYRLELKPYGWWEVDSDGEYDMVNDLFKTVNVDFWANMGRSRAQLSYRYAQDVSSQLTVGFETPLNPFWSFAVYERFEIKTGNLVEQEYRLTRDLHCWFMEFIVNQRENEGVTFLLAFKIKAFPEIGINAEKTFSPPRS